MRIVTNQAMIDRNKKIAQGLFYASLVLLVASFFLANTFAQSDLGVYFQCLMIPTLFGFVLISVRMTNTWVRQPHPWDAIAVGLKGLGGENTLYNFLIPGAEHVLVGPYGNFVLHTMFHDRPQKVVNDTWQRSGGVLAFMRQEQIGDPTTEALFKAEMVETFLHELLGDESIEVHPLIVFTHPNAEVTVEGENTVPVVYVSGSKKEKDSLKSFYQRAKGLGFTILKDVQRAALDDVLLYEDETVDLAKFKKSDDDSQPNKPMITAPDMDDEDEDMDDEPEPVGAVAGGTTPQSRRKRRGKKRRQN